jgi:hypothetical protein
MPNASEIKYIIKSDDDEEEIETPQEFNLESELYKLFKHAVIYVLLVGGMVICYFYGGNIFKMFI